MAELELLRSLAVDVAAPTDAARARARGRLLHHIRRARARKRRRVLAPALALAGAGVVVALVAVGTGGNGDAAAALALRHAAAVARSQAAPPQLRPGQFWYSKSIQAFTVTDGDKGWTALGPKVREIWLGPTRGLLRERSGKPEFLTARDRDLWVAAGRPQVNAPHASQTLPPAQRLDLPSDPDALYAKLHDRSVGNGNGTEAEMFTLVGDALRESDASPALRAALYEVASRIPGVELVGPVTDRAGRRGVAVAHVGHDHVRSELIFDPRTSALLEEETVALAGNPYGYRPGTVTGYATYVSTGVVDRIGERPRR
jgi:hypothetical protein